MPEYLAIRKQRSIMEMFRTPDLITEVTMLPIDLLDTDAAILFSDILILLDCLGIPWNVVPGTGPVVEKAPIDPRPAQEAIPFVFDGIRQLKSTLTVPLIGFCGGPFTIASYILEGQTSKTLSKTRALMYRDVAAFTQLLDQIADAAIDLLKLQISAGVDAIQVFDSWAHFLSPAQFERYSLHYCRKIQQAIPNTPLIYFARGNYPRDLTCPLSFDWSVDMAQMRRHYPQPIQGNLDPCLLYADIPTIKQEADRLLSTFSNDPAYIFNLGHGILPDIPFDHVKALVDHVKSRSEETAAAQ
jgi:uroporphyrinogen decarboxylase